MGYSYLEISSFVVVKSFQTYQDPEDQSGGVVGEGEDVVLPLEENVLSCNLGVPIVVVCTKVSTN